MVNLLNIERRDLIRAGLKMRDENEQLRAAIEEAQKGVTQALHSAYRAEESARFYRRLAFTLGAVLAFLVLTFYFAIHGSMQ